MSTVDSCEILRTALESTLKAVSTTTLEGALERHLSQFTPLGVHRSDFSIVVLVFSTQRVPST